ncbi:hypothetical protein HI914_00823 [Erysiphe necator]|nr:hypothetical protein HI914_00823 [Erysiphe necator]
MAPSATRLAITEHELPASGAELGGDHGTSQVKKARPPQSEVIRLAKPNLSRMRCDTMYALFRSSAILKPGIRLS